MKRPIIKRKNLFKLGNFGFNIIFIIINFLLKDLYLKEIKQFYNNIRRKVY